MAEFQNTIDILGDENTVVALVDRTITEFNDDIISRVGERAFSKCYSLTSVNLPNVTVLLNNAFYYCQNMVSAYIPKVTSIMSDTFMYCSKLAIADIRNVTRIDSRSFFACGQLTTIILQSESVCVLSNINAFQGTPFNTSGQSGTVYVPQALIESYQTATNWSTLYAAGTCNFVAIEGSEYE